MTFLPGSIRQLGHVVTDLDAGMRRWLDVYGVGPWIMMRGAKLDSYTYRGVVSGAALDVAFAQSGALQIELISPIDDEPSSYRDFLAAGRRGLQHLAWWTDHFDAVEAAGNDAGRTILQRGRYGTTRYLYYEGDEPDDPAIEIMELDDTTRWLDQQVRAAAEGWDGETDPIRPLF